MLFSSYEFLLLFLPLAIAAFALARSRGTLAGQVALLACSALFYAAWNPVDLGLLATSISANYLLGRLILRQPERSWAGTLLLVGGVTANLGLLGWFKYARFLVDSLAPLTGHAWTGGDIALPLAISFFTFQQIAFLVDAWRRRAPTGRFSEYALFVMFFPQLIAGPIVHHGEMAGQFNDARRFRLRWDAAAVGIAWFVIGLVKKVVLADSLAPTADAVFDAAATGGGLTTVDAWLGTLAYTLQLYFDFSGYSDMAIGLGWLFGIRLPANFNAPYQASNIGEFWRRWHMTLSRFLRDYLYIPLGGSRCSPARLSINLMLTMLLGGLWHGAGWTFVLWGGLHGLYLTVQHLWSKIADHRQWAWRTSLPWRCAARVLTLLAVMAGWVLFRSANLTTAGEVFAALGGAGTSVSGSTVAAGTVAMLASLLLFTQFAPTTASLVPDPESLGRMPSLPRWLGWVRFRPTPLHGAALSLLFLACITLLTRVKEFLYFQF